MKEITEQRFQEGNQLSTTIPNKVDWEESETVALIEYMEDPERVESHADTEEKLRVLVQSLTSRRMVQGRQYAVL